MKKHGCTSPDLPRELTLEEDGQIPELQVAENTEEFQSRSPSLNLPASQPKQPLSPSIRVR